MWKNNNILPINSYHKSNIRNLIKIIIILLLFLVLGFFLINGINAQSLYENETFLSLIDNIDFESLSNFEDNDFIKSISGSNLKDKLISLMENNAENQDFFQYIIGVFTQNIKKIIPKVVVLFVISIISGMFDVLEKDINKVIFYISFLAIISILVYDFYDIFNYVKTTINSINQNMEVIFPILLSLIAICGMSVSASVYKPIVIVLIKGLSSVLINILLPIISAITIFSILSNFSEKIKLSKFKEVLSQSFKWLFGLIVAFFTLFVTIKGISASIQDGIELRALKYTTGSFPIVGSILKEGSEVFLLYAQAIKTIFGKMVLLILVYEIVSPIIFLLSFSLVLNVLSAITEPFTNEKICNLFSDISKAINHLIGTLILFFALYCITILVLICSYQVI